jgi:hypothetical protein
LAINYELKAKKNKDKIIKKDVKSFKKYCIQEFKKNVKRGISSTTIEFFNKVTYEFQEEISELVLSQLKEEHKNINFSFVYLHYANSYKGIQMIAKNIA